VPDAVERAFAAQAGAFEDPAFNRPYADDVGWLFEQLELGGDELVLDVAAGTGHAARLLARRARAVVALDATPAMLEAGRAAAAAEGLRNVVFIRGDARALPFVDASFDVAVTRFAMHHFEDPAGVVAELRRCTRPGGQLVVADLVADPELAAEQNRVERLRDPSHTRMLTLVELQALLGGAVAAVRDVERPLLPWLRQTNAPEAEIAGLLRAELDGGPPTGLRPRERDGELWFVQRFASVTRRRGAGPTGT
jgi:SAM-dependent methyltransferase